MYVSPVYIVPDSGRATFEYSLVFFCIRFVSSVFIFGFISNEINYCKYQCNRCPICMWFALKALTWIYIPHLFIGFRTLCVQLKAIIYSVVDDHWLLCAFEIIMHYAFGMFELKSFHNCKLRPKIRIQNKLAEHCWGFQEWKWPKACPWLNSSESVRMTNRKVLWNMENCYSTINSKARFRSLT